MNYDRSNLSSILAVQDIHKNPHQKSPVIETGELLPFFTPLCPCFCLLSTTFVACQSHLKGQHCVCYLIQLIK